MTKSSSPVLPIRLLGKVGPQAEPENAEDTAAKSVYAARLLNQWREHMTPDGDPDDGSGDFEDFWEMAARLDAIIAASQPGQPVWIYDKKDSHLRNLTDHGPSTLKFSDVIEDLRNGHTALYGPIYRSDYFSHHVDLRADGYMSTKVFKKYVGRDFCLAGYDLDEPDDDTIEGNVELVDVITKMAEKGHSEVVIKTIRVKAGLWKIPATTDRKTNQKNVHKALGWQGVHLGGKPAMFMVQQTVPMKYEYRVFIVDGKPVTGAGCVEEHTPLDAVEQFSTLVRENRNYYLSHLSQEEEYEMNAHDNGSELDKYSFRHGTSVENNSEIVARLVDFAAQVANEGMLNGEMPRGWVVDCAMVDNNPVIVEINGIENAGLYASQPKYVTEALMKPAAETYCQPDGVTPYMSDESFSSMRKEFMRGAVVSQCHG